MIVKIDWSAIHQGRWYEYALRFVLGGAITATTGAVAKWFGPEVAGLFLAFPAIFPAAVTLVEKHEREKKTKAGLHDDERGKSAAALDSAGGVMGSTGLLVFAAVVSKWIRDFPTALTLGAATAGWLVVSVSAWLLRRNRHLLLRP